MEIYVVLRRKRARQRATSAYIPTGLGVDVRIPSPERKKMVRDREIIASVCMYVHA